MTTENEFFAGEGLRPSGDPNESLAGASRSMIQQPSLRLLMRGGTRALRRFPGLVVALYLVQVALSAGAAALMMMLMVRAFGSRPLFDRAMDGDMAALLTSLRGEAGVIVALFWIGVGAVVLYAVVSWFLTAGLIAVFLDAPSRGRESVRWFGAAGASNFFPFMRLGLWSLLPYAIVLGVAGFGMGMTGSAEHALDPIGLLQTIGLGLAPAIGLHWIVATAIDYARVDLVRHPGLSSARALMRGFRMIGRHPLALFHTLGYGILFVGISVGHVSLTGGGAVEGLAALILLRQLAGFLRFAAHVMLIGGQVELACATMATPLARRH